MCLQWNPLKSGTGPKSRNLHLHIEMVITLELFDEHVFFSKIHRIDLQQIIIHQEFLFRS